MSEVTIREVETQDAEEIANLSAELGYPTSPQEVRKRINTIIDSYDNQAFVAVTAYCKIVGWIHVFATIRLESEPFVEIGGIIVSENYRNRGVGKLLLEQAENWARRKKIMKLRIRSRTSRTQAHLIFTELGFQKNKTQYVLDKTLDPRKKSL